MRWNKCSETLHWIFFDEADTRYRPTNCSIRKTASCWMSDRRRNPIPSRSHWNIIPMWNVSTFPFMKSLIGWMKFPKRDSLPFSVPDIQAGENTYRINLAVALPVTILTGFGSGMVGVSGGSFLVPLMVLACAVPMHTAVGTASTLIAATALMGFSGHAIKGDFDPSWAVPLALVTILGGILGGTFALKTKPKKLKKLFAYTNWLAALFMVFNALYAEGILYDC